METRAKFILIGAFTLAGFLGIVGVFLWFARVELDRKFAYFDVYFSSVLGLSDASDVRFSGLPVGKVVDVRLSPNRDGTILVRVEVDAITPVRFNSIATIEAQGVTGVSYVLIGPGTPTAPLLVPTEARPVPVITAGRSVIQSLSEGAPELIEQTLAVVEDLNQLFGPDNQAQVEQILQNAADASARLSSTLEGFSEFAGSANDFATEISRFSAVLTELTDDLELVLQTASTTLTDIGGLTDDAEAFLASGTSALTTAETTLAEAQRYLAEDLTVTTEAVRGTAADLQAEIAGLSTSARDMMATLSATGTAATSRLTEAGATLEAVDAFVLRLTETTDTVDAAAARFDALLQSDGAPLLAEARAAIAGATDAISAIGAAARTDLPLIVADIRRATETANATIAQVGADLTAATGRIEGLSTSAEAALAQVTATFSDANATLEAINTAMETGTRTLEVAESAFAGADRFINEDIAALSEELQASMAALNAAIGQVSDEIPGISAELRAASQSAEAAFAGLERAVEAAGPQVTEFARTGLAQYTRLAEESRTLIRNLDRLTQQIQRDPARFLLDQDTPEFRR